MNGFEFLQLLYLTSTESKNDEQMEIYCFFQKIFLHSFKKALIFHCTYFDYTYPAYENHKPVHPLKNSLSSFLLIEDRFGYSLPNSIVFSAGLFFHY